MFNRTVSRILAASILFSTISLAAPAAIEREAAVHNDFNCRSTAHPHPVVLFHGLGATYYEGLNNLEAYLQQNGFCTFSITYGAYPEFPFVGGLKPVNESAAQLGAFVKRVHAAYPNTKIDFVGHSEGAFQTLYVAKFEGVSTFVDKIFAIAPPTHGTTFSNLYNLSYIGGNLTRKLANEVLDTVGCDACSDLVPGGEAVVRLDHGPIVQAGNQVTIVTSKHDELVTPTTTSFIHEAGVRNFYVQKYCPNDPVGHIGEANDQNVWTLVKNTLSGSAAGPAVCTFGSPGR